MTAKRQVEVFSAGCPVCERLIDLVRRLACDSCDVTVVDIRDAATARRAEALGVRSVPAVVINGRLADCCAGRGPTEADLQREGIGQPA
jgi:glutaredoxin